MTRSLVPSPGIGLVMVYIIRCVHEQNASRTYNVEAPTSTFEDL